MVSLDKEMMTPVSGLAPGRTVLRYGFILVFAAVIVAIASFVILIGLTPIRPDNTVAVAAVVINGLFVVGLLVLIGIELKRITDARRYGRAGARLHVRIVTLFSIIAAAPALAVAIVAGITLDLGLDRWFEIRTRTIVESSKEVAESYINENAINLRDASINMAFSLDNQVRLFRLDQRGFRNFLTQQAKGRGMLGASVIRPDGTVIHSADIATSEPLPLPPTDALETAKDGAPVIIPPGVTNLVGALIMLRDIDNAMLYTVRSVDADALNAVRLMEQNRLEYSNLEGNRPVLQLAFAILYFGLTLIMLLSAIWTGIAVANRIVRPIRQLITASDEVAGGNLEVRVPVRASDGDVAHLGETFNDMIVQLKTQRDDLLTARDTIDERRRFSEAVLSGVSAGVLGVGRTGLVHVANSSAAQILVGNNQQIIGRPLKDISPALADAYADMAANDRDDLRRQVTFLDNAGRERVLNVQLTLDRKNSGQDEDDEPGRSNTDVLTIDDISDLMEAQRSSAWADVARRIAHEIKNPLTPIQLSAERIRRRFGKQIADDDRAVFDQCTDTIIRQVGDIGRMVDEFSSFARMPKPVMEMQDLRTVIKEAAFLVEVSRNEIKFDHDFGEEPLKCLLDDRLIGQAVGNVIKNASEAVEGRIVEGRLEDVQGHILIRAYAANDQWIYLDVIDNGRGFPKANRQRLLEPYMTTREKGTGLGLAIVRKIMEDHHGRLELHDAPDEHHEGVGAMVRMIFPKSEAAFNEAAADNKTDKNTPSVENSV
jgi:two-component system nitrogen regulation sensor histidine kinase NtrY